MVNLIRPHLNELPTKNFTFYYSVGWSLEKASNSAEAFRLVTKFDRDKLITYKSLFLANQGQNW